MHLKIFKKDLFARISGLKKPLKTEATVTTDLSQGYWSCP